MPYMGNTESIRTNKRSTQYNVSGKNSRGFLHISYEELENESSETIPSWQEAEMEPVNADKPMKKKKIGGGGRRRGSERGSKWMVLLMSRGFIDLIFQKWSKLKLKRWFGGQEHLHLSQPWAWFPASASDSLKLLFTPEPGDPKASFGFREHCDPTHIYAHTYIHKSF